MNVERGVARNLLLALLRYHRLSHSVAIFCTQLDDGLRVLLPSTLTGEAIVRRYQQIDRGVLADSQLRKALATAMRSAISSKQIGTASDSIATQLVAEMQSTLSHLEIPLPVPGVAENPRKRRAKSPNCYCNASGAVFALQTRLLVLAIDAQRGAAPGDCDISKLLKLAIRYCRDGAKLWERDIEAVSLLPTDGTKTPSQMSKPEGDAHDILVAATLRLIRATAIGLSGDRSMITFSEEEYIRYLGSSTTSLQVKLELVSAIQPTVTRLTQISSAYYSKMVTHRANILVGIIWIVLSLVSWTNLTLIHRGALKLELKSHWSWTAGSQSGLLSQIKEWIS